MELNKIFNENCLSGLQKLPDSCIDCCVTSPPYFGLRDYGNSEQIGLEESPELFIEKLVNVFSEVKRVLKQEGTLWLNLGDSYAAGKIGRDDMDEEGRKRISQFGNAGLGKKDQTPIMKITQRKVPKGLKQKDLIGIPWMVAFALRANGWYLRSDIIWNKPNPMPESVTDRPTKSHEYIFLLSKQSKYYYDAESIKTECKNASDDIRRKNQQTFENKSAPTILKNGIRPVKSGNKKRVIGIERGCPEGSESNVCSSIPWEGVKANKRSVWTVTCEPFKEAHFATFPQELIIDCIKAGCPVGGVVLDPFMGAGTTALVAKKLNRNYIGFEINSEYIKIAENRLYKELGMFK